jgi:hypothetical protein
MAFIADNVLRVVGFLLLVFLPGAWLTFGMSISDISFWPRLMAGAVLSPLIACAQFYAIRLLGASFELTTTLLICLNLPVVYLVYRRSRRCSWPQTRTIITLCIVFITTLACFAPQLLHPQIRAYTGHAWYYTEPIYKIANGDILIEEPELAGIRLAYPWAGLVYQSILSYVLNSPPAASYIWTNLLWLLFTFGFLILITGELGGDYLSRVSSIVWLSFGVNFVGFLIENLAKASSWLYDLGLGTRIDISWIYWVTGDYRYSPWLLKFMFFQQEPLTLGLYAAIVYFMIKRWGRDLASADYMLLFLLCLGVGLIQPNLFPAVWPLLGAQGISLYTHRHDMHQTHWWRQVFALGLVLLITTALTFGYVEFISRDHIGRAFGLFGPISAAGMRILALRIITSAIVISPFLLGFLLVFKRCWKQKPDAVVVLGLGAVGSLVPLILLYIPALNNEYKFMFTAAICLAPFPSLAWEPLLGQIGGHKWVVSFTLALILAIPFIYKMSNDWPWQPPQLSISPPSLDLRTFSLRLADNERLAGLVDTIQKRTPADTIICTEYNEIDLPTLLQRTLYAPPVQPEPFPGVNIPTEDLLIGTKGYDPHTILDRRVILKDLFHSNDLTRKDHSLQQILQFHRPVAILFESQQDAAMREWLEKDPNRQLLFSGNGFSLWLVPSPQGSILTQ